MRWALIFGGSVVNVVVAEAEFVAVHYPTAVQVSDDSQVGIGDTYSGGQFTRPPRPLASAKSEARAELLAQWAASERVGVTFGGKMYSTDTANLARISIYAARARRAKEDSVPFSVAVLAADDSAPNLNRQGLLDLEQAIGDRFKACADNAKALRQAVQAATTVAEVRAIDLTAGWPA